MCNSDYETVEVCHTRSRKACTAHKCQTCRRTILRAETYQETRWLFEGHWYTGKLCTHCQVGQRWLIAECGYGPIDGLKDEIHEHAEEYRRLDLWRLLVGMDRGWARFDGDGFMALPQMPEVTPGAPHNYHA